MSKLACIACRRQKRKCTREMPSCELCRTNQRRCHYPADSTALPFNSGTDYEMTSVNLPPPEHTRNSFPPLFFLDSELFGERKVSTEVSEPSLPAELQELASYDDEYILHLGQVFFHSTHRILPIVSKRRFKQQVASKTKKADFLLLVLCMAAVSQPSNPAAYERAKHRLYLLERQGVISMRLLQSVILLGYHELSSAIYPAAYLTIGHCARLGQAMGIHDRRDAPPLFKSPNSWVELEETRRTWWAVFILDRFVNIALENRPFACSDVKPEELLPVEDESWDQGVKLPNTIPVFITPLSKPQEQVVTSSLAVTADTSLGASTFARTCQAADLLSRVLTHINSNPTADDRAAYYQQALQLHGVVSALHTHLLQQATAHDSFEVSSSSCEISALGICSSALLALCYTHSCAELDDVAGQGTTEQLAMQVASLDTLKRLAPALAQVAAQVAGALQSSDACAGGSGGVVADPFVAHSFYMTAKLCLWSANESGNVDYLGFVQTFKSALTAIGQRLQVAAEYRIILESDVAKISQ